MCIAEQLSADDPGEPPSPEPDDKYHRHLFLAPDYQDAFPAYTNYSNRAKEFEIRSFDNENSIEIEASIYGGLIEKYRGLNSDEQFELADRIERTMGRMAKRLLLVDNMVERNNESVALINHLPVMFEPINHAMLVGQWEDWTCKKMNIRSLFIQSRVQQRLLLGGFVSFVTYLEQR
jgi:hypothetical protein